MKIGIARIYYGGGPVVPGQPNAGAGLDFFAEQLPAYFGHASRITC